MTPETKVLVAARLSRLVKGHDQYSIERQDDAGVRYAGEAGDPSPILAADAGVSGSVSPFKRPKLAPYLSEVPPEDWTELVASSIDRLGRNARDLHELQDWCERHGKRITILSPRLHWPVPDDDFASAIVWDVLGRLAEIELKMTRKRYADTRAFLRSQKSLIGKPCWGFLVTGGKGRKTLAPDPVKVPYLLRMVEMAEAGDSIADIGRWLDAENVSPRHRGAVVVRGGREVTLSEAWSAKSVGQILRNESLYGVYRHDGKILLRHEGIMTKERWDALQAKLDANPKRRGPTRNDPMMLTDVLYCASCERVMHARRIPGKVRQDGTRAPTWLGYRCDGTPSNRSTCKNMIPAQDIETWADEWFTIPADAGGSGFADVEIMETIRVPARGHAEEVADIDQAIDDLDKSDPGYLAEVTRLYAERERLVALGTEPAHTEDRPTGVLLGNHWPTLSPAGKRDYLRRAGIKVFASKVDRWITGDPRRVIGALARSAS
jgi:DNA invertase Pin-like site-specific DNA recombinase